jgi:hypothetical protein
LFADRIGYEIYPEPRRVAMWGGPADTSMEPRIRPRRANTTDATYLHARHFIECVRSRRKSYADGERGQRATTVAHLGNIALKTGRKLRWDAATETFPEDPAANALLARVPRKPWDLVRF